MAAARAALLLPAAAAGAQPAAGQGAAPRAGSAESDDRKVTVRMESTRGGVAEREVTW